MKWARLLSITCVWRATWCIGYFWARMAQVALREIAAGNAPTRSIRPSCRPHASTSPSLFPETATLLRTARTGSEGAAGH